MVLGRVECGWQAWAWEQTASMPATGSAAGPLALHLARHGRLDYGTEIEIVQGEEIGRRSLLYATAHSDEHLEVGGSAVVVARGEFQL